MAPGVGLAGAVVHVEHLDRFGLEGRRPGDVSEPLGSMTTDEQGNFAAEHAPTLAGLHRLRVTGGSYRDPISHALIRRDERSELRALVRLDFAEDRSESVVVTPVHSLIEARFRQQLAVVADPVAAFERASATLGGHLGGLDWSEVDLADPSLSQASPTEDVRAAFVLGGLAVLTSHMRLAGAASVQAVTLGTAVEALTEDLADGILDGNDANDPAPGTGLELGDCPAPPEGCVQPPNGCALAECRAACSLYANTLRTLLSQSIATYVGSQSLPSPWNGTGLAVEDIKPLLNKVAHNADPELFGAACSETVDRLPPLIRWLAPEEDAEWVRGALEVSADATDDSPLGVRLRLVGFDDDDGNPGDHRARATVDTSLLADGPISVTAEAQDGAGNRVTETRTFWADNHAPQVTFDSADGTVEYGGAWWSASGEVTVRGTVSDAHLHSVEVLFGELVVATAVVDSAAGTWAAQIPQGVLGAEPRGLVARARDLAGNTAISAAAVLRVDETAPFVGVGASLVYDEALSSFERFGQPPAAELQKHVVHGEPLDLAASLPGSCAVVSKRVHLLGAALPLGAVGPLNSLRLRVSISDDGMPLVPDAIQVRVAVMRADGSQLEPMPWRTLAAAPGGGYEVALVADGPMAIPALLTTEGTYHVAVRATDRFGRTTELTRCWQHRILPVELGSVNGTGEKAEGFPQALYSTRLSPESAQEFGNFAQKLLNANAQGAAVWQRRLRNYIGRPVRLQVQVAMAPDQTSPDGLVSKTFVVRRGLTERSDAFYLCGANPCTLLQSSELYRQTIDLPHSAARYGVRVFSISGNAPGAEILPCSGCEVDVAQQRYTFELPPRDAGGPREVMVATYLLPTLPSDAALAELMAPASSASPDLSPGSYAEHTLDGVTFTGKWIGAAASPGCVSQEFDGELRQWRCLEQARPRQYRALKWVRHVQAKPVVTRYRASAGSELPYWPHGEGALPSQTMFDSGLGQTP